MKMIISLSYLFFFYSTVFFSYFFYCLFLSFSFCTIKDINHFHMYKTTPLVLTVPHYRLLPHNSVIFFNIMPHPKKLSSSFK